MDKLWAYFHSKQNYPEFYLGLSKKTAICKCPLTGVEELHNADRYISVKNPQIGSTVTINCRNLVFIGWTKFSLHEWRMQDGTSMLLEQTFIDGLSPQDRRYLRMQL